MVEIKHMNAPEVIAEVTQAFHAYEAALMANDLEQLDQFFWDSEHVTRYGIADKQLGIDQLRAYRTATPAPHFTRVLEQLRISSFGLDTAVAQVEFVRSDTALRGFQTQTWVRMEQGWKIVAAHVSMIPWDESRESSASNN